MADAQRAKPRSRLFQRCGRALPSRAFRLRATQVAVLATDHTVFADKHQSDCHVCARSQSNGRERGLVRARRRLGSVAGAHYSSRQGASSCLRLRWHKRRRDRRISSPCSTRAGAPEPGGGSRGGDVAKRLRTDVTWPRRALRRGRGDERVVESPPGRTRGHASHPAHGWEKRGAFWSGLWSETICRGSQAVKAGRSIDFGPRSFCMMLAWVR